MSESAQLLARIRELKSIVEEAKHSQQVSAQQEQCCRNQIWYQDHRIRAQAVQIELQEARIQDMMEKYAKHCEDTGRQMRFLRGVAFGGDGTPAVEESAACQHCEHAEIAHIAGSELSPGEGIRTGPPAPRNPPSNLNGEGDYEPALAVLLAPSALPSSAPFGSWGITRHDIELLQQIGLDILPECPAEIPAQKPQGTSQRPNGWLCNQEQSCGYSLEAGDFPGSIPTRPLPKSFECGTKKSTQEYNPIAGISIHWSP